jgi:hypothetical protein
VGKAGRKHKQGPREPSGRAKRKPRKERLVNAIDKGTEHAQAMQALYGQDGCDAIGRAYRAGLLGQGSEAKALLDMARSLSNAYWQAYEVGGFRSPIADKTHGGRGELDHERIKRRETWLRESLDTVARMGVPVRRAFYQLCIDVNPDCGPLWLDQMVFAERRGVLGDIADVSALRRAVEALKALCGQTQVGLVYVRDVT